jgi:hypothetical protein
MKANKNWYICTVARTGIHNWEICKEAKMWGIPSNGRNISVAPPSVGDTLIVYHAGSGLIAACETTGEWRTPRSKEEAPWAGGIFRYGKIIPFKLTAQLESPAKISFESNKMSGTSISLVVLRRGFGIISEKDGKTLLALMKKG